MEPRYRKIAIVGGGPTGLAAAKALALEPVHFAKIDVFERRSELGGIWFHKGDKALAHPHVPNLDPNASEILEKQATVEDEYFSAIYKYMETNLVYWLMQYSQLPFPKDTILFPKRQQVLEYLHAYIDSIPKDKNVSFNVNSSVEKLAKEEDGMWHLTVESTDSGSVETRCYDAVIIATGHFSVPFIPAVPGLAEWNEKLPHSVLHSKNFEDPNFYRDKTVLIIGNGASGVDISTQISTVAKKVIVSVRDLENPGFKNELVDYVGLVTRYDHSDKSITTANGDNVKGIDFVIYCTGYFYSMPFLKLDVITDGRQVHDLYRQIFNVHDPSLSFVALLKNIVPMPLAESQGAVIARYCSGRMELPSEEERRKAYETELEEKGRGSKFHDFTHPLDVQYCQLMQDWIEEQNLVTPGLEPVIWTKELIKTRSETKARKEQRLSEVVEHVKRLRAQGKDFEVLN
ncbi:uncharacterized protein LODBEIA_P30120 [Lodderomyces beijingensis]|uniref:Thiol-specific monooxygenase n=1 Tax=Lodderomyces beijingensis TaxID=1775926 RepID=A0ABP0ZKW3_9ASCO